MKKIFLLVLGICLLSACGPKGQQITINGQIDPSLGITEGEVSLVYHQGDSAIEASTLLLDGAFTLTQTTSQPEIAQLQIEGLGRYTVCIENGIVAFDVVANPDTTSEVAAFITCIGTPNNDLLDAYNKQENEAIARLKAADSEEEANAAYDDYIAMTYQFILDHINTLASTYLFADASYYLSVEQLGNVLSQLQPEFATYGRIPRVQASYEALVKTQVGQPYTDFALPTPAGDTLALSSLVGQTDYLLVDFWASWCGPCRRAMPALKEIYDANQGRFEVFGVSLDNDREAWLGAIDKLGLNWKHVSDLQGWKCAAGQLYGVSAIPSTVLLNKEGIIIARNPSEAEIKAFLEGTK